MLQTTGSCDGYLVWPVDQLGPVGGATYYALTYWASGGAQSQIVFTTPYDQTNVAVTLSVSAGSVTYASVSNKHYYSH